MPNIKPVSDLRNYNEVLRDISAGAPVFLTKNGRGKYAIVDIDEYEKTKATLKLMSELINGGQSGKDKSWLNIDELYRKLEEGERDIKAGNTMDAFEALEEVRKEYGI